MYWRTDKKEKKTFPIRVNIVLDTIKNAFYPNSIRMTLRVSVPCVKIQTHGDHKSTEKIMKTKWHRSMYGCAT
jgi:hypothetical protein